MIKVFSKIVIAKECKFGYILEKLKAFNLSNVDTFSFQAPEFYKKHGYIEAFALKEYPYTGKRYYYTKEL